MTQVRKKLTCPYCWNEIEPVSNHFDLIFKGIGHRGSSFSDCDWITHDLAGNRFLLMEFKRADEELSDGQELLLRGFAALPACSAIVVRWDTAKPYTVHWYNKKGKRFSAIFTIDKLQNFYSRWWNKDWGKN